MSRVGKKIIEIPSNVEFVTNGPVVTVKGPKGELSLTLHPYVSLKQEGQSLEVVPTRQVERGSVAKDARAMWGLTRALIANMITGVTEGFKKKLEIEGVGYRAALDNGKLTLSLGYSHPIVLTPPEGIEFIVEGSTVTVSGIDKDLVGKWAARIRAARPVEPYKGKGVKYEGEVVRRKAGKKVATGAGA